MNMAVLSQDYLTLKRRVCTIMEHNICLKSPVMFSGTNKIVVKSK